MEDTYNGYPNSATFCAALYLSNERKAYDMAKELFLKAKFVVLSMKDIFNRLHLQLDVWAEGDVRWDILHAEFLDLIQDELGFEEDTPTDVLAVLSQCRCEGFVVYLPCQLPRDLYTKVAKLLKDLGGPWNKKAGGHVFREDPAGLLDDVMVTGKVKKPEKFGYFPTPLALAESVVQKAEIKDGMTILEPSAGTAELADVLTQKTEKQNIFCCELQDKNAEVLKEKGYRVETGNFLEMAFGFGRFDRVVMNPPFERQADITHVLHAWNFVRPSGRLVSIMSASVLFRQDRKATEFREFVEKFGGEITENPEGSFKSSGTSVSTVTLVLNKPADFQSETACEDTNFEAPVAKPQVLDCVHLDVPPVVQASSEQLFLF